MKLGALKQYSGWATLCVALLLYCLSATHHLPSGYGIEDFLTFMDKNAISAANDLWMPVRWYGFAYLALDLVLFIPLYTLVTLQIVGWLGLRAKPGSQEARVLGFAGYFILACLAAMLGIDLAETVPGLMRLDQDVLASGCAVLCVAGIWFVAWNCVLNVPTPAARIAAAAGVAVAVICIGASLYTAGESDAAVCKICESAPKHALLLSIGCVAHRAKLGFMLLLGLSIAGGVLVWFSGAWATLEQRARRTQLRAVVFDIIARSRYIVLGLTLLGMLLLIMDQCRDVLIATVSAVTSNASSSGGLAGGARLAVSFLTIVISLISLWTLSHSSWLWARVQSRIPGPNAVDQTGPWPRDDRAETIARVWARLLGIAPLAIFVLLTAQAITALAAVYFVHRGSVKNTSLTTTLAGGEIHLLLLVALAAVVVGALFQYNRERVKKKAPDERYYDDHGALSDGKIRFSTWTGPRWEFWGIFPNAPTYLPLASLFALNLARIPAGYPVGGPPFALPILLFVFSTWLGVLGWVSVAERRYAMPWGVIPVVLAAVLSSLGSADNHIAEPLALNAAAIPGTLGLWLASASLAAVLGAAAWWFVARAPDRKIGHALSGLVIAIGAVWGLLWATNHIFHRDVENVASNTMEISPPPPPMALRPCNEKAENCLDTALIAWLEALRSIPHAGENRIQVYFVASEGGGARAAYWTAHVLDWLAQPPGDDELVPKPAPGTSLSSLRSNQFLAHTFAISGVSGGSVGAAAFIACDRLDRKTCLEKFDGTDLVTPLLGAWFFDDVIARVLPTSWCSTPGCGFLSRGTWFETTLAQRVPGMADGLWKSRKVGDKRPYLFLNSTRVETGERVIASEMRIDQYSFPNAIGEHELMGRDQSMATAAHNSARFPFTNPIALVRSKDCLVEAQAAAGANTPSVRRCLHLADGGYYDNGGGQTVIDILRGLRRVLAESDSTEAVWARKHLDPRLILIHNGVKGEPCAVPGDARATAKSVGCARDQGDWLPEKQRQASALTFSADAIGPPLAALWAGGLLASRNRADALACQELDALREQLDKEKGEKPRKQDEGADPLKQGVEVLRLSQQQDGRSYPLGWYLSGDARDAMNEQVRKLKLDFVGCGKALRAGRATSAQPASAAGLIN